MNAKIKKLAEQAAKDNSDGYPVTLEYNKKFAEKFAMLIVQESIEQIRKQYSYIINKPVIVDDIDKGYFSCGVDSILAIREYFDIK